MFLAITPHHQFWKFQDEHIALLGNFCITEETKKILQNKRYTIVSSPWDKRKIHEATPYCLELMKFWMPYLGNLLNEVYGVDKSEKYWRVLLSAWLYDYISIVYDRYMRIEKAIEELGDFATYILEEKVYFPVISLEHQFSLLGDDDFNLQIFSIILREMPIKAKQVTFSLRQKFDFYNASSSIDTKQKFSLKMFLREEIIRIVKIPCQFLGQEVVCEGLLWKDRIILSLLSRQNLLYSLPEKALLAQIYEEEPNITIALDRNIFEKLPSRNKFESIAKKTFKFLFPQFYFEKYKKILEFITPYIDKRKKLVLGVNWYDDEAFKFISADMVDKGGRLIGIQEVGANGVTINMASEIVTRYIVDTFIGQSSSSDKAVDEGLCKTILLPIPQYIKLKNSHDFKSDKCILVGNNIPKYVYRIQTFLIPEQMEEYFRWKYTFINALREDIRLKFVYRPYPKTDWEGWDEINLIKQNLPKIKILEGGSLIENMKEVKLVVSDHLASSYFESLLINVPTVWFWDKEIFEVCHAVMRYFDLLRESGILHYSPDSAAEHINKVFDNIDEWWNDKEVQNDRSEFINYMGFSLTNWPVQWADFVRSQIKL